MSHPQARRRPAASGAVGMAGSTVYPPISGARGGDYGWDSSDRRAASHGGSEPTRGGRTATATGVPRDRTGGVPHGAGVASRGGASGSRGAGAGPRGDGRPRRDGAGGGRPPGSGPRGAGRSQPAGRPNTRRRKDPLWARLTVLLGALLMMASGGAIVGGKALLYRTTSSVERAPLLGVAGAGKGDKAIEGPLNILLVGIDERPEGEELVRADSILILHIPANRQGAYIVSIPRDTYVEIPPFAKTRFRGSREKINGAFAHGWANGGGREGGFELLALTVQKITQLRFNAGAIVDFKGFEAEVNALGGVDLCVDTKKPVQSEHWGFDSKGKYRHPREGGRPMVYHPGECRRFAAWEALDYVRQRKTLEDGDYGRQRHQQQLVKALAKEARKQNLAANPGKLMKIIEAAGKTLTVDLRGASIENWLYTVRNVADSDVMLLKANGGKFHSVPCGGDSCEGLTPETRSLFDDMASDRVAQFVVGHPEFINS